MIMSPAMVVSIFMIQIMTMPLLMIETLIVLEMTTISSMYMIMKTVLVRWS